MRQHSVKDSGVNFAARAHIFNAILAEAVALLDETEGRMVRSSVDGAPLGPEARACGMRMASRLARISAWAATVRRPDATAAAVASAREALRAAPGPLSESDGADLGEDGLSRAVDQLAERARRIDSALWVDGAEAAYEV